MDLKTMFPNLTVMWTRWSDYHVISQYGMHFLVPTPDATSLTYDCTQQPGSLVADALDLGRQLAANTQEADSLCASFAAHYGVLGLDYTGDTYGAAQGYELPASMCPLNSQKYGDDLGQFQMTFIELYQHFCTVRGEEYPAAGSKFLDLSGVLNYRLTCGQTPQLIWQTETLKEVLYLFYAALITDGKPTLKVCKNCGKVYYNPHAKSEFCGTKCRNYYNVKAFREKQLGHEESSFSSI